MEQLFEILLSSTTDRTGSAAHPDFYSMVSFPDLSRPDLAVDHSSFSNAACKNKWSYTLLPPIRLHDVAKYNFTFCS